MVLLKHVIQVPWQCTCYETIVVWV